MANSLIALAIVSLIAPAASLADPHGCVSPFGFLQACPAPAEEPEPDCESDEPEVLPRDMLGTLRGMKDRLSGPYETVCQDQYMQESVVPTDITGMTVPLRDRKGRKLVDYLKIVLEEAKSLREQRLKIAKSVEYCFSDANFPSKVEGELQALPADIPGAIQHMGGKTDPRCQGLRKIMFGGLARKDKSGVWSYEKGAVAGFSEEKVDYCMSEADRKVPESQRVYKDCQTVRGLMSGGVAMIAREARFHVALSPRSVAVEGAEFGPNEEMASEGMYKEKRWDSLNERELKYANDILEGYRKKSFDKHEVGKRDYRPGERPVSPQVKMAKAKQDIMALRKAHLAKYTAIINEFPIIQHFHSNKLDDAEVYAASKDLQKFLQAEKEYLEGVEKKLNSDRPIEPGDWSAMGLLNYSNLNTLVLAGEPKYCRIATAAHTALQNWEMTKLVGGAGAMITTGFMAPLAVSVPVGLAGTAAYAYDDNVKFQAARRRLLTEVKASGLAENAEEVEELIATRNLGIGLGVPMSFIGVGPKYLKDLFKGGKGSVQAAAAAAP